MRRLLLLLVPLFLLTALTTEARADACDFQGPGTDWNAPANWSCVGGPDSGDSVTVAGKAVTIDAAAAAGSLSLSGSTQITFSGGSVLSVAGATTVDQATLTGAGTLKSGGAFTKTTSDGLTIRDGAQVVLDAGGSLDGGVICMLDTGGGDPLLEINALLTITANAPSGLFNCNAGADIPHIHITATGELRKLSAGITAIASPLDNDGIMRAAAGELHVPGTQGATSAGAYLADATTSLVFNGNSVVLGASGRIGGAGSTLIQTDVTVADGATFDPAQLTTIAGTLALQGSTPLTLSDVDLDGGTLATDRPIGLAGLDITSATLTGHTTITIDPGDTFTKTTSGPLTISDGATLVLNTPAALDGGVICMLDTGGGDPLLEINALLTITANAPSGLFNCNAGADIPHIHITATGELRKTSAGTTAIASPVLNEGTLTVASGQTMNITSYAQAAGTTTVDDGGTLGGTLSVTGGTLTGAGTVSGDVTNAGGTITPASGTLTITLGFIQSSGATTVAAGRTLAVTGAHTQTGGTTVADGSFTAASHQISGGAVDVDGILGGDTTLTGATLNGTGQIAGDLQNGAGSTVRPGSSPGLLTVTGDYVQQAGATLEIELAGVSQGSQLDLLAVQGAATLDGAVALVQVGAFEPQNGDTFQFLTSASRTGTFATLTGADAPGGRTYSLDYPSASPFGARLVVVPPPGPQNTSPPQVTGSAVVGQTLTCLPGSWTGSPAFTFEWLRDGVPIPGATQATYVLTASDATHQISCRVTATNAGGTANAISNVVTPPAVAPQSTSPPTITGTPAAGSTLTCDPGTFTGAPPPVVTIEWLRDGVPIPGQTGPTYVLTAADQGHLITCRATASNSGGSTSAISAPVTIPAPSPSPTPTPAPTPAPATTPTAEDKLVAATPAAVAQALGLPTARRCLSRRNFVIRLREPKGVKIAAARATVISKTITFRKRGGRFTARIDLRGLPKGGFTVKLRVTTTSHKVINGSRRYRTCVPKRRL